MTPVEREQHVLMLLNQVTPLIRHCAHSWHLDFEELYQDAAIHIMQLVDTKQNSEKLLTLVRLRVRSRIINTLRYKLRHSSLSLDAPVYSDSDLTIADLIPSPYSIDPQFVLVAKELLEELAPSVTSLSGNHGRAVRDRFATVLAAYC